ncbi:MAG: hypothetical protein ABUS79_32190 [Pseudomonadota bacterium]
MVVAAGVVSCLPGIRRDLSELPPGRVGFDDMCGLQDYFDTMAVKKADPPALVFSSDVEKVSGEKTIRGGQARYAFATDFQLKKLREVMKENWTRLPPEFDAATRIDLGVTWSERSGVRRVVTDRAAEVFIERERFYLPYHVCLSELLFGAPLYEERRKVLGLPALEAPATTTTTTTVATPSRPAGPTSPPAATSSPPAAAPSPPAVPAARAAPTVPGAPAVAVPSSGGRDAGPG